MSTLFGSLGANPSQATNNPFGSAKPSLFGSSNLGSSSNQQGSQQVGLVTTNTTQPTQGQQISNAFGAPGGAFGASSLGNQQQSQPQQQPSLFGQQPQQQQSIFGQSNQQQQPQQQQQPFGASIMGGGLQQQQQQQQQPQQQQLQPPKPSLFSVSQQPLGGLTVVGNQQQQTFQQNNLAQSTSQPTLGGSIFGTSQALPAGPAGSILGQSSLAQSLESSLWQPGSSVNPHQKSIPEQMTAMAGKWSSATNQSAFQFYFYNHVGESRAPYYRPPPGEDEKRWEEALAKKPRPGYVPALAVGYEQLGARLARQIEYLNAFNQRLHQIDDALTTLLQKHDLVISVRTVAAAQKHRLLSQRCLALAAKAQLLRNRGYAMSGDEEDLKTKLLALERDAFDPSLQGRSEEIWARMLGIRQRAKLLHDEMESSARQFAHGPPVVLDETIVQKAAKILDDYANQMTHLRKTLVDAQADLKEWEEQASRGTTNARQ